MDQNTLRSRQLNPCDHLFWKSRGYPERPSNWKQILEDTGYYDDDSSSEDYDSFDDYSSEEYDSDEHCQRSNANNPNNDEYWRARGWPRRPNDWQERVRGGNVSYQRIPEVSNIAQRTHNWTHTSGNTASTSSNKSTAMKQTPRNVASIPTVFSGFAVVASVSNSTQDNPGTRQWFSQNWKRYS